jgi:hypothetical protein
MSEQSKDLRDRAFRELRASRNSGSKEEKANNVRRAAAYKDLAANAEWLAGERSRSKIGLEGGRRHAQRETLHE